MKQHLEDDKAELEAHFAERVKGYLELGETPEEAALSALQKFGEQEAVLKELRQQRRVTWLRQVAAIAGMGALWSVIWPALFAALVGAILLLTRTSSDTEMYFIIRSMVPLGFTTGAAFGVIVLLAERGKNLSELSRGRVALWGALAAALFPLLTGRANQTFWTCAFGAIIAVMVLILAQKRTGPLSYLLRWLLGPIKRVPTRKTA